MAAVLYKERPELGRDCRRQGRPPRHWIVDRPTGAIQQQDRLGISRAALLVVHPKVAD
jgi:hypothetical protein